MDWNLSELRKAMSRTNTLRSTSQDDKRQEFIRTGWPKEPCRTYPSIDDKDKYPTHDTMDAKLTRIAHPHLSWCLRCGFVWSRVIEHSTWYTEHAACFPLCEGCWEKLGSPEARIEYYGALLKTWEEADCGVDSETRNLIAKAVANGY